MGRKRVKQRAAVGVLGKDITRRSRGKCELCGASDQPRVWELPPFPEDPDPERTLMLCERCRTWLEKGHIDPVQAHFLSSSIWSELAPVKLASARLLLTADFLDDPWLLDALEAADVDPDTGEFREAG